MVEFAGLKDQVTVVVGPFDANFEATLKGKTVDVRTRMALGRGEAKRL